MRTIRTSSNDHDGQPQRVVMRFLAICVSEVRCLRIVWSYRGSRGLRPYFYKRVRQTCVRRRSGVRDRENAFSASPHHARVRAQRAPPARARARARARDLHGTRTRIGLRTHAIWPRARESDGCVRACVRGWLAGCCVRACVRACVAGWLAAGCWLHQNVPRTRQNSQEQAQSDPRTHQNDPRIVCLLVCLFVSLFVSVCLLVC